MANSDLIKYLLSSLLGLLIGSRYVLPPSTSASVASEASKLDLPVISDAVLTDSWPIKKVVSAPSGDVLFAGGDFRNGADGLVLVTPSRVAKLASTGDPVPGRDGLFLAAVGIKGIRFSEYYGDFSVNDRGETAFSANLMICNSPSMELCAVISRPREGLFLFSGNARRTVALQGDPAPGTAGGTFYSFEQIVVNNTGKVVFAARVEMPDQSAPIGLFVFGGDRVEKILLSGEATSWGVVTVDLPMDLFLTDQGAATFIGYGDSQYGALFRSANGTISRLAGRNEPAPPVGFLGWIHDVSANNRGDVVFRSSGGAAPDGLYLRSDDGSFRSIIQNGDVTPIGRFQLLYQTYGLTSFDRITYHVSVDSKVNDSGEVLFAAPVTGGSATAGLFLFSQGEIKKVASDGESIGGDPGQVLRLETLPRGLGIKTAFSLNNLGMALFSAGIRGASDRPGLFRYSNGIVSKVLVPGDPAPAADGASFADLKEFSVNDFGEALFHSTLCCGRYKEGIFIAPEFDEIPNGGFEIYGPGGLPAGWTTSWNNSGSGGASLYASGGHDAFAGDSVLRLHVKPGGGSTFLLSDPIPIPQNAIGLLTSRLRYNLASPSDAVYFSATQYDTLGNPLDFDEVEGVAGDNQWNWISKELLIHPARGAMSIRIRFGLISSEESYLDVDAVQWKSAGSLLPAN